MSDVLEATIYMEPVGKARARTVRTKGGKVMSFTPDKTAAAENLIRDKIMGLGIKFPSGVPIRMTATFFRSRPKSRKKDLLPTTRPDLDNYVKLLTDAMEKFAYDNDSQITTLIVKKRFVDSKKRFADSTPRIHVIIEEDDAIERIYV